MKMLRGVGSLASAVALAMPAVRLDAASSPRAASSSPSSLQRSIAQLPCPAAIYVNGPRGPLALAHGMADPGSSRTLTIDTPVRIASNTKTFVAATILRLWEDGRLNLDAPIAHLLSPPNDLALRSNGYDTQAITVRQLLSHSSGLADHAADHRYLERVLADRKHRWTREEQVKLGMSYSRPLSAPGSEFSYSDTGYVLLGDIIERITRTSLAQAVREELGFERIGLRTAWWELQEDPPRKVVQRAHQFLAGKDVTDVDASVDLYGGGGLVMSPRDLGTFFEALFQGRIFRRPQTLTEMLWRGAHKGADQYRLGIEDIA